MRCKFCFAKYNRCKELTKFDGLKIIELLANSGVEKINFAGGEPFLKSHLGLMIKYAHSLGMGTGVITNGSKLTSLWIDTFGRYLDWLGISIDSVHNSSNIASGRVMGGSKLQHLESLEHYLLQAKTRGIQIKINTVVSAYNANDYLGEFIGRVKPDRWKIFQALPISGANDGGEFEISADEYQRFLTRHSPILDIVNSFPETNELMTGSYLMINPAGCFYQNDTGKHKYSDPILKVGVEQAFHQIVYDHKKFIQRGGATSIQSKISI